jgi:methyl-accepting chemotaxis protein
VAQSIRQLSDDAQAAVAEIRRTNDHIASRLKLTVDAVERTGLHMNTCSDKADVLHAAADQNCELATGVSVSLGQFHAVLDRQARRVHALDADIAVLDRGLEIGKQHARRLDDTAGSLGQVASAMRARLASVT